MKPAEQRAVFTALCVESFAATTSLFVLFGSQRHHSLTYVTCYLQVSTLRHWLINRRSPPVSSIEKLSISPSVRSLCFKFLAWHGTKRILHLYLWESAFFRIFSGYFLFFSILQSWQSSSNLWFSESWNCKMRLPGCIRCTIGNSFHNLASSAT